MIIPSGLKSTEALIYWGVIFFNGSAALSGEIIDQLQAQSPLP